MIEQQERRGDNPVCWLEGVSCMELVCFSSLFQPIACAAPQDRAALGGGRASPGTARRPRTLLSDLPAGFPWLCCPRAGSPWSPTPGLRSGPRPISILWQGCRGRGGSDWKCSPRVTEGDKKGEANLFYNAFCNFFCF